MSSLASLRAVIFERRRASVLTELLQRQGAEVQVAPAMREVPLEDLTESFQFGEQLLKGKVDIILWMTGVGAATLLSALETRFSKEGLLTALQRVKNVARGPKPVGALKKWGLAPDFVVPEPNTWRDLLHLLDAKLSVSEKCVAVQEYGVSNGELLEALKSRDARVVPVSIYRWALPEDLTPLREAIHSIVEGRVDLALFTSSQQVHHLVQVAQEDRQREALLRGLRQVLIASIGPTTSETLRRFHLSPDFEPNSPKMADLVKEVARCAKGILKKKKLAALQGIDTGSWRRVDMVWPKEVPKGVLKGSLFLKACRLEPTEMTPVWFMRQAGRFLREYRELRGKIPFKELCLNPDAAAEITLMAVERLGVDAAIIFADILLVLEGLSVSLSYERGDGPRVHHPLRTAQDVGKLELREYAAQEAVPEAIRRARRALDPAIPLLGFAGGLFTVAAYAIEGGAPEKSGCRRTKIFMVQHRRAWDQLLEKVGAVTADYLRAQIDAGANALQIFDSWVGVLSPQDYALYVLPHTKKLFALLSDVPTIHFGTGTQALLPLMKEAGGDVLGLDWRVDIAKAWKELGYDVAVQGNLDPCALFGPRDFVQERTREILEAVGPRPGHIFNLGHGILPATPIGQVLDLVDFVHEHSRRLRSEREKVL